MLPSKCNPTFNYEFTIMQKEKQITLTAFPEIMSYFKDLKDEDILEAEVDITYDKKKIIVKFEEHKDELH